MAKAPKTLGDLLDKNYLVQRFCDPCGGLRNGEVDIAALISKLGQDQRYGPDDLKQHVKCGCGRGARLTAFPRSDLQPFPLPLVPPMVVPITLGVPK
jgi:hypothetical protein